MLRQLYALLLVVLALAAASARYSLGIRDSIMVWHTLSELCDAYAQLQRIQHILMLLDCATNLLIFICSTTPLS
jgi:hypothetical protein